VHDQHAGFLVARGSQQPAKHLALAVPADQLPPGNLVTTRHATVLRPCSLQSMTKSDARVAD
jgi:hypothetical protein